MVTTFSARLLSLTNKCNSAMGRQREDSKNGILSKHHHSSPTKRSRCFDHSDCDRHNDYAPYQCVSNKRRKQKEELQYAAASIETSLANAGHPPISSIILKSRRDRVLPIGSVDMDKAKVISSSEYDKLFSKKSTPISQKKIIGSKREEGAIIRRREIESGLFQTSKHSETDAVADFSSCFDYESLIKSTQTCYNSYRNISSNFKEDSIFNDDKTSENSDSLSSWAPSLSCIDLNEKKYIDNDNRSDGQSSESTEDYFSSSDFSSSCGSSSPPLHSNTKTNINSFNHNGAFSIVG